MSKTTSKSGGGRTGGAPEALRRAIAEAETRGISQYRLAELAGVRRSQVLRIAKGETTPRLDTAEQLLAALNLELKIVAKMRRSR